MGLLSRRSKVTKDLDPIEPQPGAVRSRRRRRLVSMVSAVAVAIGTGAVVAIASPAEAAITSPTVRQSISYVQPNSGGNGSVTCSSGEVVLSGGALIMSLDSRVRITMSWATANNKWYVWVQNPTNNIQEIHVRAMRAKNVSWYNKRFASISVPPTPNSPADGSAACLIGEAVGGGFQIQAPESSRDDMKVSASYPSTDPEKWNVQIRNDSGGFHSGEVQVICALVSNRYAPDPLAVSVGPQSTNAINDSCGNDAINTGGGYSTDANFAAGLVTASLPSPAGNDYWKLNLVNPDSVQRTAKLYVVCVPK